MAEARLGRIRAALRRLHQAAEKEPGRGEIHACLIHACVWLESRLDNGNSQPEKLLYGGAWPELQVSIFEFPFSIFEFRIPVMANWLLKIYGLVPIG